MKIIIASPHCCKTDLIEYQNSTIKKYVLDADYEYYVFNDGSTKKFYSNFNNDAINLQIRDKCKELNIKCINIPEHLHRERNLIFPKAQVISSDHPSARASVAVQYIFNYFKQTECKLIIIESDMLFINYINLENYLDDAQLKFSSQTKANNSISIEYMWIGILFFNMSILRDKDSLFFDCGTIENVNVDSGGWSHYYLQKYKDDLINTRIDYSNLQKHEDMNVDNYTTEFLELCSDINNFYDKEGIFGETFLNNCLYHIRTFGSSWNYSSRYFLKFLNDNDVPNDIDFDTRMYHWKKYNEILSNIIKKYIDKIHRTI